MALVESRLVEYLHQKAERLHIPLSATFEISPVCNMDCSMCYVKKTPAQVAEEGGLMTVEQWIAIAKEAQKEGLLFILLTGGEPFFYPEFKELYEKLHEMGFVLSINSNGTLITEEVAAWLKKMPPSRINLTLYGASDATYERLCRNPQGFTQAERAITLLQEAGICVKLNASITRHNRSDLKEMIAFAKERKLMMEVTAYMFPPLRKDAARIGENDRLSPEETTDVFHEVLILQNGREHLEEYQKKHRENREKRKEMLQEQPGTEGYGIQCRAATCTCWITWDGRMLPCGMMTTPEADLKQLGFAGAWKTIQEETAQIRLPLECRNCPDYEMCHTCAAMIYAETGSFQQKPEYRCRMVQEAEKSCAAYLKKEVE